MSADARRDLVARLLGSVGPEATCEECFDVLDEYVDRELTAPDGDARMPRLRAHLDACPACREDYESLRELVAPERGGTERT